MVAQRTRCPFQRLAQWLSVVFNRCFFVRPNPGATTGGTPVRKSGAPGDRRGDGDFGRTMGITYPILALVGAIPYIGAIFGLTALVCWII